MDSDILHEGRIKYHAMSNFAVEASTGVWRHHADYSVNHRVGNLRFPGKASVKMYPSLISFYYYFPETAKKNLMLYTGAGAGWYKFNYIYQADTQVLPGDIPFEKEDDTWGYHILGGLEYFPKKDFSFKGEIRYTRADVSADVDNSALTPNTFIDLTGYTFFMGLNYYFREAKE
jgi:outer membrane protein W